MEGININKVSLKNIKEYLPIKSIKDNLIYLKNNERIKLFKIEPINFNLKTENERIILLQNYKQFLKNYNYDIQIIIQTDCIDLSKHLNIIENFKNSEPGLSYMVTDYIEHIKNISNKKECVSRKFYIAVLDKNSEKFKNAFSNLDNVINECSNQEIVKILQRYFKKYVVIRKELKWV